MRFLTTTKVLARTGIVLVGITLLTSVSIDATDSFRNSQSALSIIARNLTARSCPLGTSEMVSNDRTLCVDSYEAGVGSGCPVSSPQSDIDTAANANTAECKPISVAGTLPWRFVTLIQADQMCARAGKRLLTAFEWYTAARGTPDNKTTCGVTGTLEPSGAFSHCKSGIGAFDMIGNVWELVSDLVIDGAVKTEKLPVTGYVTAVTPDGLPMATAAAANVIYNKDYFWNNDAASGTFAIIRGGYYGSGEDGGMYSSHTDIPQNFSGVALGFRCVMVL